MGGLQTCPATTVYTWTLFCPASPVPPSPTPTPTPTPSPVPTPSPGSCDVGDTVSCPGSGAACAGSQCCPDGSTCPSAAADFSGCPKSKEEDCTGAALAVF